MRHKTTFDSTLRRTTPRYFPKKILVHRKIPVTENYAATASIWVANTPESTFKPRISLSISHSRQKVSLSFDSVHAMLAACKTLWDFVRDKSFAVHEAYGDAYKEYLSFHEERRLRDLNDNTEYTVIQDITPRKYDPRKTFVNKITGEILGDVK